MSKRRLFLILLFIPIFFLVIYLAYYSKDLMLSFAISSGVQENEVTRLNSSDGRIDAVIISRNAGAMSSMQYYLYVVPRRQKPDDKDSIVFGGEKLKDLKISWAGDRKLFIQYTAVYSDPKPIIYAFKNQIQPFSGEADYLVEINKEQK
jgi:hypothetical protein